MDRAADMPGTTGQSGEGLRDWVRQLFVVIDAKDAEGFAGYFHRDGRFVFPRFPVAEGKSVILEFVESFFSMIDRLQHTVLKISEADGLIYVHFDVKYWLKDQRTVTIQGLETIALRDGLVRDYVIYLDPQPLLELLSET